MPSSDTMIGRTFDKRYVIKRKLGSGGMAVVYLAEDQELGRPVALKLLDDRHASDEQFVERFRREAQSAAGLNHPNIVSIFDRGHAAGTYYIAMEYLDGRTLKELLVRNGPTPVPIAIDYARQILGALSFAHRNGIVHRDIKPHNIIVGSDGRLKVTDFGIARSGASQMTEAGSIVGTAQYLSPEQARGAPVDPRSDLYSLGIVLYEMLTGSVPFTGDTPVEIAMKHLSQVPEPPSTLRPDVPHDLDAVVMRSLAKAPEQRYDSAEEMDADLARVARGVSVSRETEDAMTQVLSGAGVATAQTMVQRPRTAVAPPPVPPVYRSPGYYDYEEPPGRRSIWPWVLAVGLILAGAAGGWFLYTKIQDQLNNNKPVAVPDVMLMARSLAVQKIQEAGLNPVVITATSDTVAKGQVSGQNPGGGSKVGKGSTIALTVSSGKPLALVPNVVGLDATSAVASLAQLGLNPKITRIYSGAQQDTVTAQQPHAGDRVVKGTVVHINVSRGAKPVTVPDVTTQPFANAKSALNGQGFVVARVDIQSDLPQGTVVAEDPPAGTSVPSGSKITLSVSKGPATTQVPDVTGQTQAAAEAILQRRGPDPRGDLRPRHRSEPGRDRAVHRPGAGLGREVGRGRDDSRRPVPERSPGHGHHDDSDDDHDGRHPRDEPPDRRHPRRPLEREPDLDRLGGERDRGARAGRERGRQRADRPLRRLDARARPPDAGTWFGDRTGFRAPRAPAGHARWRPRSPTSTSSSRCCTGRSARTGRCRACSSSPMFPTSERACSARRSAWTRTCSRRCCATAAFRSRRTSRCALGDEAQNPFGYPVFVKPARLGSSVGITKAHDDDELRRGVALAFEHDEKVLVERFVSGIEVEVGVLGNQRPIASLPGEIVVTHNEWYDYEAKYDEGEMDLIVPARLTDEQLERAQELAVRAFVATDCEGMARADMFVRDDGEVLVNELNTIPGFTATSVYARLFEASGIGYAELLQRLADLAVERFERRRQLRF